MSPELGRAQIFLGAVFSYVFSCLFALGGCALGLSDFDYLPRL